MARDIESLLRQGEISGGQAAKFNLTARKTKHQNPRMAGQQDDDGDPDDRGGLRDQGGIRDVGDKSVAGNRHIDTKQRIGVPAAGRLSGAPRAGAGGQRQPTKSRHIDAGSLQRPQFPPGGSKAKRAKAKTPPAARGTIAPQGGQYGGGGRNTQ